jgi:hypothetical protein
VCSTSWRWLKYALRQAGGAGGVEGGGLGVLVEIGEVVVGRRRRQQGLVLTGQVDRGGRGRGVLDQHEALHRLEARRDGGEDGQELGVHQHHVGAGVVEGVQDLLGRQAHVHRLQDGAHHRHREEAFEVAVAVPVHHRHGVAGLHAQPGEHAGQPADALAQLAVAVAPPAHVGDLLVRRHGQRRVQELLDEQRIGVGVGRALDQADGHGFSLPLLWFCEGWGA